MRIIAAIRVWVRRQRIAAALERVREAQEALSDARRALLDTEAKPSRNDKGMMVGHYPKKVGGDTVALDDDTEAKP